jgi:hypothetical protein
LSRARSLDASSCLVTYQAYHLLEKIGSTVAEVPQQIFLGTLGQLRKERPVLGFGVYTAVDLALVVYVLPNQDTAAKDLGVLNFAGALPFSIAPGLAPTILGVRRDPAGDLITLTGLDDRRRPSTTTASRCQQLRMPQVPCSAATSAYSFQRCR